MMLKKIAISVFVLMLIMGTQFQCEITSAASERNEAFETICGLGLFEGIPQDKFVKEVSRAEMARVIYNICCYGKQQQNQNGQLYIEYQDVDKNHTYYNAIAEVVNRNIMVGYTDASFSPDKSIILSEVLKVLLDFSGYSEVAAYNGGYPLGYYQTALGLNLLSSGQLDKPIDFYNLAKILYQSLYINIPEISIGDTGVQNITLENNENVLSRYLKLNIKTGVVTDNSITSFEGNSSLAKDYITIGSEHFKVSGELPKDILGRHVKAYYNDDDILIYTRLTGKDEIITIDINDVQAFENSKLTYYNDNIMETLQCVNTPKIIYNGVLLHTYDLEALLDFGNGEITLINTPGADGYDVIKIDRYISCVVNALDSINKIIYANDINEIALSNEKNKTNYEIFDAEGNKIDFDNIVVGSILDIRAYDDTNREMFLSDVTENVYRVYLTDKVIFKAQITDIEQGEQLRITVNNEDEYIVDRDYIRSDKYTNMIIGHTYTLYINMRNMVCLVEETSEDVFVTGIMCKTFGVVGVEQRVAVEMFQPDTIKMPRYLLKKKVLFSDFGGNEYTKKDSELLLILDGYHGIFRYKLNNENEISYLELPVQDSYTSLNKLHLIIDSSKMDEYGYEGQNLGLAYSGYGIGGKAIIGNTTKLIYLNPNQAYDSIDRFSVYKRDSRILPFSDTTSYTGVKAYTTIPESPLSEYFLYETDTSAADFLTKDTSFAIIKNIAMGLGLDGEHIYKVRVMNISHTDVVEEKDLFVSIDAFNHILNVFGDDANTPLELGDIIRYKTNFISKTVDKVWLVWDENAQNPAFPTGKKGSFPGTIGYFDVAANGKTNPFGFVTSSSSRTSLYNGFYFYNYAANISLGAPKFTSGQVYSIAENYLKMTTQDLTLMPTINEKSQKYVIYNFEINKPIIVDISNRQKPRIYQGNILDIKTFREYGNACSRVVWVSRGGSSKSQIIIND